MSEDMGWSVIITATANEPSRVFVRLDRELDAARLRKLISVLNVAVDLLNAEEDATETTETRARAAQPEREAGAPDA